MTANASVDNAGIAVLPVRLAVAPRRAAAAVEETPQTIATLALGVTGGALLSIVGLRQAGVSLSGIDIVFLLGLLAPLVGHMTLALATRIAAAGEDRVTPRALHTLLAWSALPLVIASVFLVLPRALLTPGWFGGQAPALGSAAVAGVGAVVLVAAGLWGAIVFAVAAATRFGLSRLHSVAVSLTAFSTIGIVYYLVVFLLTSLAGR